MKKLIALFAILVLAASVTFAGTYNVSTTNSHATGLITITGAVEEVPLVISPKELEIELPSVKPGNTVTIDAPEVAQFTLSGAFGYKVAFYATVDLTDDHTSITCKGSVDGLTWYDIPEGNWGSAANPLVVQIPNNQGTNQYYSLPVWFWVNTFTAEPGAAAGNRTFTLTLTADYNDAATVNVQL